MVVNVTATAVLGLPLVEGWNDQLWPEVAKHLLHPAWVIPALIVFGYPVGVALRLFKNADIDEHSALYYAQVHHKGRLLSYPLGVLVRLLLPLGTLDYRTAYAQAKRKQDGSGAEWLTDHFFYGNWMARKCGERLPAGAADFYDEYWRDKYTSGSRQNTTFFNFCKSVVLRVDERGAGEVCGSEAMLRFVAGSYYALRASLVLMVLNVVFIAIRSHWSAVFYPAFGFLAYLYLIHVILMQYRPLRCKDVDTVFHACFAIREKFDELLSGPTARRVRPQSTLVRTENMLRRLWEANRSHGGDTGLIKLKDLLREMRSEAKNCAGLASLYFAGADLDHPYFLRNKRIAVGLAVLPEGADKAKAAKRHPHQTEVLVVLEGSLRLFCRVGAKINEQILKRGDHFVIPKNTCHWVEPVDGGDAAYLFLKTNPAEEPREEPCSCESGSENA